MINLGLIQQVARQSRYKSNPSPAEIIEDSIDDTQQELTRSLAPNIAASDTVHGNRSPGPGLGVNYVVFPPPKSRGSSFNPKNRELYEEAQKNTSRPSRGSKEDYEFTNAVRIVRPFETPDGYSEAHEEAREDADDNKKQVQRRYTDNVLRPLNRAPVKKQD